MKALVLTAVVAAAAGTVLGQSLAEVAARDQERRARAGTPPKRSYTDSDLRASPSPGTSPSPSPLPSARPDSGTAASPRPRGWKAPTAPPPATSGRGMSSPAPSPSPEPDRSAADRAALEARWRAIGAARRDALARAEARVAELDARITALRNDLSPVGLGDPNRQQTMQAGIAEARRDLEAARAAALLARQGVDSLEADALRAGALPGWVR